MDNIEVIIHSHEARIQRLESSVEGYSSRLGTVEDSTKSAWHKINETNDEMGDLYDELNEVKKEVNEMKTDVKGVKAEMQSQAKLMKWIAGGVIFLGVAVILGAIIASSKGSDVPEKTIELMIPAVQKILTSI